MAKAQNKIDFNQFIKMLLVKKGMTANELADKMGFSATSLSLQLSRNDPKLSMLIRMLEGIGEELTIVTSDGNKYSLNCNGKAHKKD